MKGERTEVRRWRVGIASEPIPGNRGYGGWRFDTELWGHTPPDFESELLDAAPLLDSLEQLAGEWESMADSRTKEAARTQQGNYRATLISWAAALGHAADDLTALIQSLNPEEVDTNAG